MKLYIDENGRTICERHGGTYLKYAIEANPRATNYDTPLANWELITDSTREEFDLSCETCGHG